MDKEPVELRIVQKDGRLQSITLGGIDITRHIGDFRVEIEAPEPMYRTGFWTTGENVVMFGRQRTRIHLELVDIKLTSTDGEEIRTRSYNLGERKFGGE